MKASEIISKARINAITFNAIAYSDLPINDKINVKSFIKKSGAFKMRRVLHSFWTIDLYENYKLIM